MDNIAFMSQKEYAAKNDNIEIFEGIAEEHKFDIDEKNNSVFEYICTYNSENLMSHILNNYNIYSVLSRKFKSPQLVIEPCIKALFKFAKVDELKKLQIFGPMYWHSKYEITRRMGNYKFFNEKYFRYLLVENNIGESAKQIYVSKLNGKEINTIIEMALVAGNEEILYYIWDYVCRINDSAKKQISTFKSISSYPSNNGNNAWLVFAVLLEQPVIDVLLQKGYFEIVRKNNEYRKYFHQGFIEEDKLKYLEGKFHGTLTDEEEKELPFLKNGVIILDKLLETKDYEFVEYMLNKYPIHFIELWYKLVAQSKWDELTDVVRMTGKKGYLKWIEIKSLDIYYYLFSALRDHDYSSYHPNIDSYKYPLETGGTDGKKKKEYNIVLEHCFANWKKCVLDDLQLKLTKERAIEGLTEEYFLAEIEKHNFEIVIVKLCVRLEAILRHSYKYEGTFAEMLKKYCDVREDNDYFFCYQRSLLEKIRIARNDIVHGTHFAEYELTVEELKCAVNYICKLN